MLTFKSIIAAALLLSVGSAAWAQYGSPGEAPSLGGLPMRATGLPAPNLPLITGAGGRVGAGVVPQASLPGSGINPSNVPTPAQPIPTGTALGAYPPGTALSFDAYGRATLATPSFTPAATTFGSPAYYISATGSDAAAGTIQAPFLTPGKCQTQMRTTASFTGTITGGTTTLTVSGVTGTIAIGQVILTQASGSPFLGVTITAGSGASWTVNTGPTGTITAVVMTTAAPKKCYFRAGSYVMASSGLHLTSADAGTYWGCYPPDGINTCILDGSALSPLTSTFLIQLDTGATGVTFNGFTFLDGTYIVIFSQADNATWTNNLIDGLKANPWYGIDVYGHNILIAGNTIQNMGNGSLAANGAVGIAGNATGIINSLIFNNTIQCISGFGIEWLGNAAGNIIAYNYITGIGDTGSSPPSCLGVNAQNSGTGYEDLGGHNELAMFNTVIDTQGYAMVSVGQSKGGGNIFSDNYVRPFSDPALDMIGGNYAAAGCVTANPCANPNGVIRRNTMVSPASIAVNLGDENDTCDGVNTTRQGTANNALVLNNNISATFEPLYITASQNSVFQGNTLNIANQTSGGTAPHYASGISFIAWAADGGGSCTVQQNSSGNTVQLNNVNSNNTYPPTQTNTNSKYGVLFEAAQAPNTVQFNILFPFGPSGLAPIQNNSAGTITSLNNQTATAPQPFTGAPPIADAGPSELVVSGQSVSLNGAGSRNFPSGTVATGVTYTWTQILGTGVTLSGASTATLSFTAPTVTQCAILGFKLVVANAFGSTYDQVYVGVAPQI